MIFKHLKTGARLYVVSELDDGEWMMVEWEDGNTGYVHKAEIQRDPTAERKVKPLQVKDAAAQEDIRKFPPDTRLNINTASARQIADHIKGVGLKTAKDIIDLRLSIAGERFSNLEQLKQIPRVDWEAVLAADLIRV
jgi:competence ComEA-like helix-hairpin-helix protein